MVLVDKENVKGYVQMDEKEHTKKEYASKGLAGTALGLGIGGLAVSLLNNGCNPLGIFGRNCGTNAGEVAIAANEQYLERKQCADWFRNINKNELDNKIIESAITFYFKDEDSGSTKTWNYFKTAN